METRIRRGLQFVAKREVPMAGGTTKKPPTKPKKGKKK